MSAASVTQIMRRCELLPPRERVGYLEQRELHQINHLHRIRSTLLLLLSYRAQIVSHTDASVRVARNVD